MKIMVLIPWRATEEFMNYHRSTLPKDVDLVCLKDGQLMDGNIAHNLPTLLSAVQDAEKQGYDAVVVGCLDDPGVEIIRSFVNIPVLGPMNIGLHISQMIGHKTLLLAAEINRTRFEFPEILAPYGLLDRVVIRGTRYSPPESMEAYKDYKATGKINQFITEVVNVCVKSIEEDGIDVIVLGCGGLKWMKEVLESELPKRGYPITVIAPIALAAEMAKTLVAQKLSHNKIGYPGRRAHRSPIK